MDISWIIFCSFLILFMQAGFLSLETGMTRSKNGVNVAMKNLSDFVVTLLVFWLIGPTWYAVILALLAEFVLYEFVLEPAGLVGHYFERGPRAGERFRYE